MGDYLITVIVSEQQCMSQIEEFLVDKNLSVK